jgi:hypothetical protein
LFRGLIQSLPTASTTVFFNPLPSTTAGGAGLLRLKVAQWRPGYLDCHSRPTTGTARADFGTWFDTISVTGRTRFQMTNANLFFSTKDGLLEINFQVKSQVIAHHWTTSTCACPTGTTTTHASTTKERIKDITQINFLSKATTKGRSSRGITGSRRSNALFAKPIVFLLEIRVVENFVGTVNVLKLFSGILTRVGIYIEIDSELERERERERVI